VAAGIQHVQAAQLIEVSPPRTGGIAALKDIKKGGNSNSECGTYFGGRPFGTAISLFRRREYIHSPMDHSKNIDLIRLYVIDNSVGTFDHFSN
jgi:hypothetical protein